jgi:hypothetical protein
MKGDWFMLDIYCLMVEKISLTDKMRTILLKTAKIMVAEEKKRQEVVAGDFRASVRTDFNHTGFGSIYGVEFAAEIDTPHGSGEARYIVRTRDLEAVDVDHGFWTRCCGDEIPLPQGDIGLN